MLNMVGTVEIIRSQIGVSANNLVHLSNFKIKSTQPLRGSVSRNLRTSHADGCPKKAWHGFRYFGVGRFYGRSLRSKPPVKQLRVVVLAYKAFAPKPRVLQILHGRYFWWKCVFDRP